MFVGNVVDPDILANMEGSIVPGSLLPSLALHPLTAASKEFVYTKRTVSSDWVKGKGDSRRPRQKYQAA